MKDLCRSINKKVSARKKGAFHFKYSKEEGNIYISSPIASEKVILNNNLKDVLGLKLNIINGKSAGNTNVIFADYPPAFSTDNCIFVYASFVETSRVGNSNRPLLGVLERKPNQFHIHHYTIKHFQYIPVNTFYLEFCQLTLRTELDEPLVISKGLAVIRCYFLPIVFGVQKQDV